MTTEQLSQKDLAKRLDLTTRQIRNLHSHGIPRLDNGKYPWPDAQKWWVAFKQEEKVQRSGSGKEPSELDKARAEKERALAQLNQLKLEKELGNLVSIDYLDQQLLAALQQTRQVLNNLPGKIAPRLVGCPSVGRAQLIIQEAIDEAMPSLQAIGADPALDDLAEPVEP